MMPGFEMRSLYNHEISMRDGTILRGNLYRPVGDEKVPVLLLRSIFRKDTMSRAFAQYDPAWYVQRGYAVYIQDARGLGESDGEFDRFTADGPDGYDTIEYLAAQPWCTGKVGMFGSYFAGYLQLMAAAENPPHLCAMVPMQTSVSINRDCNNRGFMFYSHIGWCMSRLCNRLADGRYDEKTTAEWLPKLRGCLKDYFQSQLPVWPHRDMPVLKDNPFPIIRDYFRHLVEGFDDFDLLHKEGRDMDVSKIRVPAFYISGWFDSSRTPLIDHCMDQRKVGVDSRVLVAPWHPGDQPSRADGALESGVTAIELQQEITTWFDHWLKDAPAPETAPVRYCDIFSGKIYNGRTWPSKGNTSLRLYLAENGTLTSANAAETVKVEYFHDPRKPLPYRGYGKGAVHPQDPDGKVLSYVSEPSEMDQQICGLPTAFIQLSGTAKDADVMISLSDQAPDGSVFTFADGASRARYRNGWTPEPLQSSNEIVDLEVLMGNVYYHLPKGHRLLVQITGSAFPKYDVNHGTAARPADDADGVTSTQTVWSGGAYASYIDLPLEG